ncbi:MAG TPA: dynamin family protein, partial [Puia sp.]|nr:dynamin family protein [Puia sp.]
MENLGNKLEQMKELAIDIAGKDFIAEITALQIKIQTEKLYIVVVGLFKKGKSSLINAILKKEILPVGVTPLTAIVTLLEYTSGEPFVEVLFKDGRSEIKSPGDISSFVSEDENPDNQKQVDLVRICDNTPLLKLVSLVDTPGLGSAFEHNTNATLQFVPKIDAAIVVLGADLPISKIEMEFLENLKDIVPKLILALNKIDLVKEEDLKKIIAHDLKVVSKIIHKGPEELKLFLVSACQPNPDISGAGVEALTNYIENISRNEKSRLIEQSSSRQFNALFSQLEVLLRLKQDTLSMPVKELEQKKRALGQSISLMQEQKGEFQSIITTKVNLLQEQIHNEVNKEMQTIRETVNKKIEETKSIILEGDELEDIQSFLNDFILVRLELVKKVLENATKDQFKALLQQYSSRSQSFLNELAGHLSALMGISFDIVASKFDLDTYTSFYLTLDSGTSPVNQPKSLANLLLPQSIRRQKLSRKLKNHYGEIIVRNASSIIYDLQYKIQESFRKFNYDLNNRTKELLESIEKIIA